MLAASLDRWPPKGVVDTIAGDDAIFIEFTVIATDGILTDFFGLTLYTFDDDEPGVSNCAGSCEDAWPPMDPVVDNLAAGEGVAGVVGLVTRDDGFRQVTYNDQPLYYFSNDAEAGDRNGDGIGGVWHIILVGG